MRRVWLSVLLVLALLPASYWGVVDYALAYDSGLNVVYARDLPFYEAMEERLVEYRSTGDWRLKVHPVDLELGALEYVSESDLVYVEVYVLDPEETVVYSRDLTTGEIVTKFYVYQAREAQVEALRQVPHTYFYVSKFEPCVCMEVEPKHLKNIAKLPFVYCIRIIPGEIEPSWVFLEDALWYDRIKCVMIAYDSDVDPMQIAVIDSGYDPDESRLNGEASNNIRDTIDFTDGDRDVSDGDNSHGTTITDLIARAFGDVDNIDPDGMYDDPKIFCILKAGEGLDIYIANM